MAGGHDHFLSATHLRGFLPAGERSRIFQMDLATGEWTRVSVRDAGVERNLNTVIRDGVPDRALETYMATAQEDAIGPLLRRLRGAVAGPLALTPDENGRLSRYMALTYARSPQWRAGAVERQHAALRPLARDYEDPLTFEARVRELGVRDSSLAIEMTRMRSLIALRDGRVPDGVEIHPWPISVGIAVTRVGPVIAKMNKFLVRREEPPFHICGDCAVVLMLDGAYYAPSDLGVGQPSVRIAMPIGADALVLCTVIDDGGHRDLLATWSTSEHAVFVNRASVEHALRVAWGRDPDDLVAARSAYVAARGAGEASSRT